MAIFMNGDGTTNRNINNSVSAVNKITPVNNTTPLGTAPIANGGGFKNPSNNMTNNVAKVKNNVQQSVIPGRTYDNKVTGTNQARQTVYNYTHNITPTKYQNVFSPNNAQKQVAESRRTLPDSAPLSVEERAERLRADLLADYNMKKTLNAYVDNLSKKAQATPIQTANGTFTFNPNNDIGTQITTLLDMNPTYSKEVADVLTQMQNARIAKILADPTLDKYMKDDIYKRATDYLAAGKIKSEIDNGTFQFDPNKDIGMQLTAYMNANPTYSDETANMIRTMLKARNDKILENPSLNQYLNDEISRAANNYLANGEATSEFTNAYEKGEQLLNQSMSDIDKKVDLAMEMLNRERERQIKEAEATAMQQRRNMLASAPISDLQMQEQLSSMGLSRGANNSSGYGETARLMNQLGINNQISDNYNQLAKSVSDYNNAYTDAATQAQLQAMSETREARDKLAEFMIEGAKEKNNIYNDNWERQHTIERDARSDYESDRDYEANRADHADDLKYKYDALSEQSKEFWANLDWDKEKTRAEQRLQEIGLSIDEAKALIDKYDTIFKDVGYATPEVAKFFGVPVGTPWVEVTENAKDREANIQVANINANSRSSGSGKSSSSDIGRVLSLEPIEDSSSTSSGNWKGAKSYVVEALRKVFE